MASAEQNLYYLHPLSDLLKKRLGEAVHMLYLSKLENAKEVFDQLLTCTETELQEHPITGVLSRKLATDLIGYAEFDDAVWLLQKASIRKGKENFESLLNCALIAEGSDDHLKRKELNLRLLDSADNQTEHLLAKAIVAAQLHEQHMFDESDATVKDITMIIKEHQFDSQKSADGQVLHLILVFEKLAFLSRKPGGKDKLDFYFRRAMELSRHRTEDFGLAIQLETYWVRAFKVYGKQDQVQQHMLSLISMIDKALENIQLFELNFGIKVLREAFNEASVACSFHEVCGNEVAKVGEKLFMSLLELLGEGHFEVTFVASQMVYNYDCCDRQCDADRFLSIVLKGMESFGESTKMMMEVKAKTLIHLWKLYLNRDMLQEAELYCREQIRVNRKHGISQQYVANALRHLAFIVKERGDREEELGYLRESLRLSREFKPGLKAFHNKVENEIRKF